MNPRRLPQFGGDRCPVPGGPSGVVEESVGVGVQRSETVGDLDVAPGQHLPWRPGSGHPAVHEQHVVAGEGFVEAVGRQGDGAALFAFVVPTVSPAVIGVPVGTVTFCST